MKIINISTSRNNFIKQRQTIFNDKNVSIKSQAALILLNEYYKYLDVDFIEEKQRLQKYLNQRHNFLRKQKRKHGDLVCHYCGKNHLEIGLRLAKFAYLNNKNKNLATIDHIVPQSANKINPLDTKNWVVSCRKCNSKKGSKSYEEFIQTIKKF